MNMKDLLIALAALVLLCLLGPIVVGILSALVNLPALTEEQQESLDEDESILLDSPIPDAELDTLESCIRLCGEGIDILDARCLYAVACNKHTRDMYEANIGAVLRHLLDSHHHPGKEDFA